MRVVFLNPPGKKIYIRGYFCSQTSKAEYFPPPIDFIMMSAQLSKEYELFLIDAIKDRLSVEKCLQKIIDANPDAVIFLSGLVSWNEDVKFLNKLKERTGVITIGIGDIFLEGGERILKEYSFIDALLMDFCNRDINCYLEGDYDKITHMVYRYNSRIVIKKDYEEAYRNFEIPIPRHDLFIAKGYIYPFVRSRRYTCVLTDYGCPYKCSFCVMGTLAYKYRSLENILIEMDYLKQHGAKEILFMDQSFGVLRERNNNLYKAMIEHKYNFKWVCYSRVDLVDHGTLVLMKKAGCHTIIFGVETADNELLRKYRKGYTVEQIECIFKLCREIKIRTVATFILGLPEDTKESCYQTIAFAKKIKCDFASFNFTFPRSMTELRAEMISNKLVDTDIGISDQSGSALTTRTFKLSTEELSKIRDEAIRRFYLRPIYLIRQIFFIRTFDEACNKYRNGLAILRSILMKSLWLAIIFV